MRCGIGKAKKWQGLGEQMWKSPILIVLSGLWPKEHEGLIFKDSGFDFPESQQARIRADLSERLPCHSSARDRVKLLQLGWALQSVVSTQNLFEVPLIIYSLEP